MSNELAGILGVGATLLVGLGGLQLTLWVQTSNRLDRLEKRLDKRLDDRLGGMDTQVTTVRMYVSESFTGLDKRLDLLNGRMDSLQSEVRGMDQLLARIKGMLEGAGLFSPADSPASAGD